MRKIPLTYASAMSNMTQPPQPPTTDEGDAFFSEERGPFRGINLTPVLPPGLGEVSYP